MLIEPVVENSGIPQGQVMQRQQLQRDHQSYWHWRNLNLGMNIFVHGRVYRIVNCDEFTTNWYAKQGNNLKVIKKFIFIPGSPCCNSSKNVYNFF